MRRRILLSAMLLLGIAIALEGYLFYSQTNTLKTTTVYEVIKPLKQGDILKASDVAALKIVGRSSDHMLYTTEIPVGKKITRGLTKGDLLKTQDFSPATMPDEGTIVIALNPEDAHLYNLKPSEQVEVLVYCQGSVERLKQIQVCSIHQNMDLESDKKEYITLASDMTTLSKLFEATVSGNMRIIKKD